MVKNPVKRKSKKGKRKVIKRRKDKVRQGYWIGKGGRRVKKKPKHGTVVEQKEWMLNAKSVKKAKGLSGDEKQAILEMMSKGEEGTVLTAPRKGYINFIFVRKIKGGTK